MTPMTWLTQGSSLNRSLPTQQGWHRNYLPSDSMVIWRQWQNQQGKSESSVPCRCGSSEEPARGPEQKPGPAQLYHASSALKCKAHTVNYRAIIGKHLNPSESTPQSTFICSHSNLSVLHPSNLGSHRLWQIHLLHLALAKKAHYPNTKAWFKQQGIP